MNIFIMRRPRTFRRRAGARNEGGEVQKRRRWRRSVRKSRDTRKDIEFDTQNPAMTASEESAKGVLLVFQNHRRSDDGERGEREREFVSVSKSSTSR